MVYFVLHVDGGYHKKITVSHEKNDTDRIFIYYRRCYIDRICLGYHISHIQICVQQAGIYDMHK